MAKTKAPAQIYQLKIVLQDTKPPIWRRVEVADSSLAKLHDVIQASMGWSDFHMHAFDVGGEQYGEPDPELEFDDEAKMALSQVAGQGFKKIRYTYDFGDSWEHLIQIEKTLPAAPGIRYPRCSAGKRACPPEDCGGTWGYRNLLAAIQDLKHPEHEEMLEWIGGEFDPEEFDPENVNAKLRRLR